ncbi:MAG: NADH-quinone oxidoreductase subunit NuoK [Euryarchaeota archaeon]|nr:NADH-quinone oxidoreductase subunit NuoK [Euryarchaeota archaeon]
MALPLTDVLVVSSLLFTVGICGVLSRKNALIILMSIEVLLNAASLNFIAFSVYGTASPLGQVWALVAISLAAAEAAIGMAIYMVLYRTHRSIDVAEVNVMRW